MPVPPSHGPLSASGPHVSQSSEANPGPAPKPIQNPRRARSFCADAGAASSNASRTAKHRPHVIRIHLHEFLATCGRAPCYAPAVTLRAGFAPASRRRRRGIFCRSSAGSIGVREHLTSAPDAGAATDLLRGIPVKAAGRTRRTAGEHGLPQGGGDRTREVSARRTTMLTEKGARTRAPSAAVRSGNDGSAHRATAGPLAERVEGQHPALAVFVSARQSQRLALRRRRIALLWRNPTTLRRAQRTGAQVLYWSPGRRRVKQERGPEGGRLFGRHSSIGYVVDRYPRYSDTFIINEILAHEADGVALDIFSLQHTQDTHFQSALAR